MGKDDAVAQPDEAGDGGGGAARVRQLFGDRSFFAGANQRVTTDRNQNRFPHGGSRAHQRAAGCAAGTGPPGI
jgi:hypothetical protein